MESQFDPQTTAHHPSELALRVYTSHLLAHEFGLAAAALLSNLWRMARKSSTSRAAARVGVKRGGVGFAPLRLSAVRQLIKLDVLDNGQLITAFGAALKHPGVQHFPLETLLHAIVPFK